MQNKYNELKKKVRQYQRHIKAKEAHYMGEIERLQDSFGAILMSYKNKVDCAYQSKERLVSLSRFWSGSNSFRYEKGH